nr:unnamed protein product [Digitaria exilis]
MVKHSSRAEAERGREEVMEHTRLPAAEPKRGSCSTDRVERQSSTPGRLLFIRLRGWVPAGRWPPRGGASLTTALASASGACCRVGWCGAARDGSNGSDAANAALRNKLTRPSF